MSDLSVSFHGATMEEIEQKIAFYSRGFESKEGAGLDINGVKWDAVIHSEKRNLNKDGSYRLKRGFTPKILNERLALQGFKQVDGTIRRIKEDKEVTPAPKVHVDTPSMGMESVSVPTVDPRFDNMAQDLGVVPAPTPITVVPAPTPPTVTPPTTPPTVTPPPVAATASPIPTAPVPIKKDEDILANPIDFAYFKRNVVGIFRFLQDSTLPKYQGFTPEYMKSYFAGRGVSGVEELALSPYLSEAYDELVSCNIIIGKV